MKATKQVQNESNYRNVSRYFYDKLVPTISKLFLWALSQETHKYVLLNTLKTCVLQSTSIYFAKAVSAVQCHFTNKKWTAFTFKEESDENK